MNIFSYEPFSLPPSRVCSAFSTASVLSCSGPNLGEATSWSGLCSFVFREWPCYFSILPSHRVFGPNKWHCPLFERLWAYFGAKAFS